MYSAFLQAIPAMGAGCCQTERKFFQVKIMNSDFRALSGGSGFWEKGNEQ
jgi:hypothetical protein